MQLPGKKTLKQLLGKCKEQVWTALSLTTKWTKQEGQWLADVHPVKGKCNARQHTQMDLGMEDAQTKVNCKKWNVQALQCLVLKK